MNEQNQIFAFHHERLMSQIRDIQYSAHGATFSNKTTYLCVYSDRAISIRDTVHFDEVYTLKMDSHILECKFCKNDTELWILTTNIEQGFFNNNNHLHIYAVNDT